MAKVMISLPDEVLSGLDRCAKARGTSRSGLLRELAGGEIARAGGDRRRRLEELLGDPAPHGGDGTAAVREARRDR